MDNDKLIFVGWMFLVILVLMASITFVLDYVFTGYAKANQEYNLTSVNGTWALHNCQTSHYPDCGYSADCDEGVFKCLTNFKKE